MDEYQRRVEQQKLQYANKAAMKGLPKVFQYWTQRYLVPKVQEVFGERAFYDVYARSFIAAAEKGSGRILSIGSGDGQVEVAIAEKMLSKGFAGFKFLSTELAEVRLDRARKLVAEKGLSDYFEFLIVDVNAWEPDEPFSGVMAQHTLHHIVELERMFDFIDRNLEEDGVFPIVDMIGRNGHMRWPETLEPLERLWAILPEKYKYNHQSSKLVDPYVNWDCSKSGFEGIRAQDILPLLCDRFSFESFLGTGGFVDIFIERDFGHNFDPESSVDMAWFDTIATMNDAMLETGAIKPTMIFAVARKKRDVVGASIYRGMTPEAAIRQL
ncbi:MAG: class I SAM-dependent methyltransferase [Rhizobiales bacterium]|nr:class I SAM-dependent methyltransferase [Hyphomicrobiales bacterium]